MSVLQQPDVQIEDVTESASFGTENLLGMIELSTGFQLSCDLPLTSYPTPEIAQDGFQDGGSLGALTQTFPHHLQLLEYGIFNATCDPPMSFRSRHRLLDGIYNSYSDPTLITAEAMGEIARKVGLLMEEVLAWFKDEKLRRVELLYKNRQQAQVSTCEFPPSPESTRASGEASSASSSYNSTSPGKQSQPLDAFSPFPTSANEKKMLAPPKSKRGRPAKTHIKTESNTLSLDTKRKKISIKYPCPDCGNFVPSERYAEHINRKHFPENVWECPKINQQTGKPCSSNPNYRPSYRLDNFATHLKGEHDCCESEIVELRKSCKFEVFDFFHKICGFCDKTLGNRDESIEHLKEHFGKNSRKQNPPTDLGLSLWREKCGSEHKLKLGVHYRRSQALKLDLMNADHDHDHDGHDGEDGRFSEDNSKNSDYGSSDSQSNSSIHDRGNDEGRHFGKGYSGNQARDNPESQPSDINHNYDYDHGKNRRSSEDFPGILSFPISVDTTLCQDQHPRRWPELQISSDFVSIGSEESKKKVPCAYPDCKKVVKDLRAHLLTHENERPEKCPIQTCDYHIKGFARKYDKNRHTLTHCKATMVCGFCPSSGSAAKSFNRVDVFKRHLTSAHEVEMTFPKTCKNISAAGNVNKTKKLSDYGPNATGKCSTCSEILSNAQDFYEHLDDCILRIVQQEELSEAIRAAQLAEAENYRSIHETVRNNALPTTVNTSSTNEDPQLTEDDDDYKISRKKRHNDHQKHLGHIYKNGSFPLMTKHHRKRKDYPSSWSYNDGQVGVKKKVLCVFDGPRRLLKDDWMLDTDYEVHMKLSGHDAITYLSDFDVQKKQQAKTFHNFTRDEKSPWIAADLTSENLEKLMEAKHESPIGISLGIDT